MENDFALEVSIKRALGQEMMSCDELCSEVWSALANVEWHHRDGIVAAYSFRAAGALIATIIERGSYLDWYCCAPDGIVSDRVAAALAREGWTYELMD